MRICDSLRVAWRSLGSEERVKRGRHCAMGGPRSPLKMQNAFDNLYLLARLPCVINYQIEIAFDSPSAIFFAPGHFASV